LKLATFIESQQSGLYNFCLQKLAAPMAHQHLEKLGIKNVDQKPVRNKLDVWKRLSAAEYLVVLSHLGVLPAPQTAAAEYAVNP